MQVSVKENTSGRLTSAPYAHDVVVVISSIAAGGAQRVATTVMRHWADRGLKLALITLSDSEADFFAPDPRVHRTAIGGTSRSSTLIQGAVANVARVWRLRRTLRSLAPRTIVSFTGATNILTILATRRMTTRVVVSERNDPTKQMLGFPWDLMRRKLYRYADVVTAISHGTVDQMAAFVPREKLVVLPLLTQAPPTTSPADIPKPAILSVARMDPQKGHDILLEAFARAIGEAPGWTLVLVGDGPLRRELEESSARLGISEKVIFTGRREDPYPYYAAADIFAFPSRFEGMGNALLEAMSCGLPPIVSDASPGPLELVTHGVNGIVVRTEDPEHLAAGLLTLMHDENLRRELGHATSRTAAAYGVGAFEQWDEVVGLS